MHDMQYLSTLVGTARNFSQQRDARNPNTNYLLRRPLRLFLRPGFCFAGAFAEEDEGLPAIGGLSTVGSDLMMGVESMTPTGGPRDVADVAVGSGSGGKIPSLSFKPGIFNMATWPSEKKLLTFQYTSNAAGKLHVIGIMATARQRMTIVICGIAAVLAPSAFSSKASQKPRAVVTGSI